MLSINQKPDVVHMETKGAPQPDADSAQIRAVTGASWLIASKFVAKMTDALVLVVLARLLNPIDFGLVALAMSFIFISEAILEMPVGQALLRLHHVSEQHLDTAFTLNFLRGVFIILIVSILSYPISIFSDEPRLPHLLMLLSIAPAIRGLSSPRLILYIKNLDFRRDVAVEIGGKLVGGVLAITIAFCFGTYWALAAATLATPATMTIISYLTAPFRPRLSLKEWHAFAHFVSWNFATQLCVAMSWQCDRILLGRYVTAADLGRYTICNDISNLPQQALIVPLTRPLASIIYNKSSSIQAVQEAYLAALSVMATFVAPIYIGLFFLAAPTIHLLLGQVWGGAENIASILALSFLPGLPVGPWQTVAIARGKSNWLTVAAFVELAVRLPLTWLMVSIYGVSGAAWTRVLVSFVLCITAMVSIRRLICLSLGRQLNAAARPALSGLVMALVIGPMSVFLIKSTSTFQLAFELLAAVLTGAVVYVATIFLTWRMVDRPAGIERLALRILFKWLKMLNKGGLRGWAGLGRSRTP